LNGLAGPESRSKVASQPGIESCEPVGFTGRPGGRAVTPRRTRPCSYPGARRIARTCAVPSICDGPLCSAMIRSGPRGREVERLCSAGKVEVLTSHRGRGDPLAGVSRHWVDPDQQMDDPVRVMGRKSFIRRPATG